MEKREPSCTVDGNVNWYNHYGNQYGSRYLRNLYIELPYDPVIPLLGIYADKTLLKKKNKTGTRKFTAALFTIAKTWKQPKRPLTDDWTKVWYVYTIEYYSAIKRTK